MKKLEVENSVLCETILIQIEYRDILKTMLGPPVFNNLFKPQTAIFVTYHSLVSIIMEEQIQYSSMADFI